MGAERQAALEKGNLCAGERGQSLDVAGDRQQEPLWAAYVRRNSGYHGPGAAVDWRWDGADDVQGVASGACLRGHVLRRDGLSRVVSCASGAALRAGCHDLFPNGGRPAVCCG